VQGRRGDRGKAKALNVKGLLGGTHRQEAFLLLLGHQLGENLKREAIKGSSEALRGHQRSSAR